MHAMSIVWVMLYCFGCAAALAPLERFPGHLPATDTERLLALEGLAPLVARGARGCVFMTLGLVGLLSDAESGLAMPTLLVLFLLSFAAIAMATFTLREVGVRLIRVRRCAQIASHAMLWTGVLSLSEGVIRRERVGALLLGVGVTLLAASRVTFVLTDAADDLLQLSGD